VLGGYERCVLGGEERERDPEDCGRPRDEGGDQDDDAAAG
jgi:hypothetical protein